MFASKSDQEKAAAAKTALNKFEKDGYNLDPENPAHCNAYLALRATTSRIKAHQVENYMKTLDSSITNGDEGGFPFLAVPIANFPDGVPKRFHDALVPENSPPVVFSLPTSISSSIK
jgi:hypothetical protein